jgi:isopentenyl-diphosphate delta-isomerase
VYNKNMTNNTNEELVDLVDKNDKLLGSVAISKANSDPNLIHREIAIIIYDKENRVLLQRRGLHKKIDPGSWSVSCAGHVTYGLTPLQAAHKELVEEVGFDTDLEFFEKEFNQLPSESRFSYWYKGKFPENSSIKMEPEEVIDTKFISESELKDFQKTGNKVGKNTLKHLAKFWSGC